MVKISNIFDCFVNRSLLVRPWPNIITSSLPMVIGPVFDYTNSWGITLGILAIPMFIGLVITLTNRQLLDDCYNSEMSKRLESE